MQTENMAKKMLIDATHAEETRVVVVDGNKVEEFDFESENKRQLAGNIYLAKVTRVEPSLQAAFVDYGGNRHGFLAFSEIHPDYYQIPVADREALMEEERAQAEAQGAREDREDAASAEARWPRQTRPRRAQAARGQCRQRRRDRPRRARRATRMPGSAAWKPSTSMPTRTRPPRCPEGSSPMETVGETPVAEPDDAPADVGRRRR